MVKKSCDKELSTIQKLKIENKELREKNSKLSNFIKHNRHKLSNPSAADEIITKCNEDEELKSSLKKEKNTQEQCPKCYKNKFLDKKLEMPNKSILQWKQCSDVNCAHKSTTRIVQHSDELFI